MTVMARTAAAVADAIPTTAQVLRRAPRVLGPEFSQVTVTLPRKIGPVTFPTSAWIRTDDAWRALPIAGDASVKDAVRAARAFRLGDDPTESLVHHYRGQWMVSRADVGWMGERTVGWKGSNTWDIQGRGDFFMDHSSRAPFVEMHMHPGSSIGSATPDAVVSDKWALVFDRHASPPTDPEGFVKTVARPISEFLQP